MQLVQGYLYAATFPPSPALVDFSIFPMYIDENRARHVVLYLNSQLQTLWKISAEYVERHGNYLKPEPQYRE